MIEHVHKIGRSICNAYSFLPDSTPVHLFMDNSGGHVKKDIKEKYVRILKEYYNVEVEWQVPNSPETNMLDLGTWYTLQSYLGI